MDRMRMLRSAIPLFALVMTSPVAQACSVTGDYRVPTNLELAQRAELILLGTVLSGDNAGSGRREAAVHVRPTLLLKGAALPPLVSIPGQIVDARSRPTPSNPRELHRPHPDTLGGACTRYLFSPGMKLVLFFERRNGELAFAGHPFARVSEDVPSQDAPWVKAVRLYAKVAALPASRRRAALAQHRAVLRKAGDADSRLIAADIDRELAALRPARR